MILSSHYEIYHVTRGFHGLTSYIVKCGNKLPDLLSEYVLFLSALYTQQLVVH